MGVDQLVPVRLYGDDAEDLKGRSSLILTWSSATAQHIRSDLSRFLITILPLDIVVTELTYQVLYEHVTWSFHALLRGEFPRLDPHGKPWTDPARLANAGRKLDERCGAKAALAEFCGDWKFLKEALHLTSHYNRSDCCHQCAARRDGCQPPAYDFSPEALWQNTIISHEDFIAQYGHEVPALVRLPGFHKDMIRPDTMHVLHLGVCQSILGSAFIILIDLGLWGVFAGDRSTRSNLALQAAYVAFKEYTRRRYTHSQRLFTLAMLNREEDAWAWPLFKGKAHNTYIVLLWLNAAVQAAVQRGGACCTRHTAQALMYFPRGRHRRGWKRGLLVLMQMLHFDMTHRYDNCRCGLSSRSITNFTIYCWKRG